MEEDGFGFGVLLGLLLGVLITSIIVILFVNDRVKTSNDDQVRCEAIYDVPCAELDGEWYPLDLP